MFDRWTHDGNFGADEVRIFKDEKFVASTTFLSGQQRAVTEEIIRACNARARTLHILNALDESKAYLEAALKVGIDAPNLLKLIQLSHDALTSIETDPTLTPAQVSNIVRGRAIYIQIGGDMLSLTNYVAARPTSAVFSAEKPLVFSPDAANSVFDELYTARIDGFTTSCGKIIDISVPMVIKVVES